MNVLSINGLEVQVNGTIWYEPEYQNLGKLIKTKGQDYVLELLNPAGNAAGRSVVGRYTPEELYSSKRDVIEDEIKSEVVSLMKGQYVTVKRVLVKDVKLPESIKNAIEVQNVTKVYGVGENSVTALKDANLTINDNEFFTLLGPSGCGKTTLLRLIAGFEDITK